MVTDTECGLHTNRSTVSRKSVATPKLWVYSPKTDIMFSDKIILTQGPLTSSRWSFQCHFMVRSVVMEMTIYERRQALPSPPMYNHLIM